MLLEWVTALAHKRFEKQPSFSHWTLQMLVNLMDDTIKIIANLLEYQQNKKGTRTNFFLGARLFGRAILLAHPIGHAQNGWKLDDIIKEKTGDLIVHDGTNGITNNVNFLTNVKKIFNKVFKESPSTSIAFSSIINRKDKTNIQKTLTDTNARLKNFYTQKEINFIDNSGFKEFHLGKRNFI